jgi:hypothetical protein
MAHCSHALDGLFPQALEDEAVIRLVENMHGQAMLATTNDDSPQALLLLLVMFPCC